MRETEVRPTPPPGLVAAQDLARAAVNELLPRIVEGVSERELAAAAAEIIASLGSTGAWTPPTTRLGIGTLVAHPEFPMQDRRARAGDIAMVDLAPVLNGWFGDYAISTTVGSAPRAQELVDEVRDIQREIIASVMPGMRACDLFRMAAELAHTRELKVLDLLDNIGHSIGTSFAEDGFIDAGNVTPMWGAWTIEPQLGRGGLGAKFEDILWLAKGVPPLVI